MVASPTARSVEDRTAAVVEVFQKHGSCPPLDADVAESIVKRFMASERKPPGPSVGAQGKWARIALLPVVVEWADLCSEIHTWSSDDVAEGLYTIHKALGDPLATTPALEADVTAYGRVAAATLRDASRLPSRTSPRLAGTRPAHIGGILWLVAMGILACLQSAVLASSPVSLTWLRVVACAGRWRVL